MSVHVMNVANLDFINMENNKMEEKAIESYYCSCCDREFFEPEQYYVPYSTGDRTKAVVCKECKFSITLAGFTTVLKYRKERM